MIDRARRRSPIAQAVSLILGTAVALPALAQTSEPLEEVIVTGIRGSLTSSMNLKRDAQGVTDVDTVQITVTAPSTNQLPLAVAGADRIVADSDGQAGETISLNGSASSDAT